MFVLPLISFLSVLNKLIGNICGGGKQARTRKSMIRQENINFEANTRVGHYWNHSQCFKYIMLSNCPRLSGGKLELSTTRLNGDELEMSATRLSVGKWG